jgi:nitrate reductase molybdenum cofactor assembly chaperone NarJ/NarW
MTERHPSPPHIPPAAWNLSAAYRAIAELLLNPEFRDNGRIAQDLARLQGSMLGDQIELFVDEPGAHDIGEYTQTLELAPPVPLYLGAYMYEEPSSCRGAGASGRNTFMIEIAAIYEHFGVSLGDSELPDFVPVVVEFLAVSLDHTDRDGIGLRRRLVEKYVQPGLPALRNALKKYESVYDRLIEALEMAVNEDLERMADDPVWLAPDVKSTIPQRAATSASLDASRQGGQHP